MRRMIGRPARALLPLALGGCAFALGADRVAGFALAILAAQLFSLCAGAALYAASGAVVSEARLRGNFILAAALGFIGAIAATAFFYYIPLPIRHLGAVDPFTARAGGCVMLAALFADRLYTMPDRLSAPMCDAITATLVAAGLVASRGDSRILFFFSLAAMLACAVAAIGIGGAARARPGFAMFREIPRAMLRTWLAPALLMLLFALTGEVACFAGWAILAWADAPARRNREESGAVVMLTTACAALAAAAAALFPDHALRALLPMLFACGAAALAYATLDARAQLALLVYCAASVTAHNGGSFVDQLAPYLAPALALIALLLLIPDAASALRLYRARRKARKRRKQA
ncbi:MAG: hypothetical protein ACOYI5_09740 [Christensenellales bacterium]|jgi:hypothetical protein